MNITDPFPTRRVSTEELRRIFNHEGIWDKIQAGELQQNVVADRHPAAPLAPVPYCTHSQFIIYVDSQNQEVARAHQYLLPDGSIGASGRPDPKRVFFNGILYYASSRE